MKRRGLPQSNNNHTNFCNTDSQPHLNTITTTPHNTNHNNHVLYNTIHNNYNDIIDDNINDDPKQSYDSHQFNQPPLYTDNEGTILTSPTISPKPIPFEPISDYKSPSISPNYYIQPQLLSMESINTSYSSYIHPGMGEIPLKFTKPWKHEIISMGDTGANINAISAAAASKLYNKYIDDDNKPFRVRTGGGYITCKQYIPFSIESDGVILHYNKFYVIPDLPFDYLIGRPLLLRLGYDLQKIHPTFPTEYHHQRENLDCLSDEDMIDNPYPVKVNSKTGKKPTTPQPLIANRSQTLTNYIRKTLTDHNELCAKHEFDIGCIPNSEFKIEFLDSVDTTPIRCAEYPHNIKDVDEIVRQLQLMVVMGLISRSDSPWRFPTFIVPKKNGEARIVFDYRKLNAITKRLAYSLPSIPNLMRKFKNKKWISTIDIKSGYWHIPIRKADRPKTAFIFNGQVYEWNVMPFGPTNAPPHFQKVMDNIFADMDYVMVYMDDITILSSTAEEHQKHLAAVFSRLATYKIKIRPDKCQFAQQSVPYLGFQVDGNGIRIKPKYKDKIQNIPVPQTLNQLRRFVGMVQYLHQFIPNLQQKLKPFHGLTNKNVTFKWNTDLEVAFKTIKDHVMNADMVYHPDTDKPFAIYCDASVDGVGAVLTQVHDGQLRPVSFCSKLFNQTQRNWHISEQEIYAVIHAVEKWRQYLIVQHFTVYTDHLNLQELFNRAKNFRAGKLYRWAVRLQEFDFTAKYISGKILISPQIIMYYIHFHEMKLLECPTTRTLMMNPILIHPIPTHLILIHPILHHLNQTILRSPIQFFDHLTNIPRVTVNDNRPMPNSNLTSIVN